MDTAITAEFGDGEYVFHLKLPQLFDLEESQQSLIAIEESLRAGIGVDADGKAVFVGGGAATAKDMWETVRYAMIGGGSGMVNEKEVEVGPISARRLLEQYAYPARPLCELAVLAWQIANATLRGPNLKKKPETEKPKPKRSAKAK